MIYKRIYINVILHQANIILIWGSVTDLDRTDFALLRLLQKNVRSANKELAYAVGIAPSTCHERVKRLWASGTIKGANLLIDPVTLGYELEALFMIELAKHERKEVDSLLDHVSTMIEVRASFLITGRYDLIVHVVARNTEHLKNIAFDHITCHPAVTRIETSIVYDARSQDNFLDDLAT
jgi:DNA-binding Lrp family transcriptional regulator